MPSNVALLNQRLFAFALIIKCKRVDSTIVTGNYKRLAAYYNISDKSFTKYINKAIEARIVVKKGNNWCFVSWPEILRKLDILHLSKGFKKLMGSVQNLNLHQTTQLVRDTLILFKLRWQKIKLDRSAAVRDTIERLRNHKPVEACLVKKVAKMAANLNLSTKEFIDIPIREFIVTGSKHLSKSIPNHPTTLNNSLNRLVDNGTISRKVITNYLPSYKVSKHSCDYVLSTIPNSYVSGRLFKRTIGSVITILN